MNKYKILAIIVTVYILTCGGVYASTVPWSDNFESYTNNQPLHGVGGWTASTNEVVAQNSVKHSGSLGGYVPADASLTNTFSPTYGVLWVDMYTQPTLWSGENPPDVITNASILFYFNSNGYAVVCNGSTSNDWVVLTTNMGGTAAIPITAGTWTRVTIYLNYSSKRWALIVNDELLRDRIHFVTNNSAFTKFSIRSSVYLDDMSVTTSMPSDLTGDVDNDRMSDVWELRYFGTVTSRRAGMDYDGGGRYDDEEYADGTDPTNPADDIWTIPYYENFESGSGVITSWHGFTVINGDVRIQSDIYLEGTRALSITGGCVELSVATNAAPSNRWFRIYAKPTLYDGIAENLPAGETGGFYVDTEGKLMVYSSNAWTNVMSNLPTNSWIAFAVHIDYANSNWDIYVNTNGTYNGAYNVEMQKANIEPLLFSTNVSSSSVFTITITNGASLPSYLDLVAIAPGYTNCSTVLTNLAVYDRLAGRSVSVGIPPCGYYTNSPLSNTLHADAELGNDLARGLLCYDTIRVFTTGWNVYKLDAFGVWQKATAGSLDPQDMHFGDTMGFWLERTGGRNTVVFYPYAGKRSGYPGTSVIYALTDSINRGWTALTWPSGFTNEPASTGWDFGPIAGSGDEIYVYENYSYYRKFYWDGTRWKEGQQPATYIMKSGQGFWYKRKGSQTTWVPSQ